MCLLWLVYFFAAHDAEARAPVFVDVEAIDFDVGGDAVGEGLEAPVNAKSGSDEIYKRWLVADSARAEEFRFRDVSTSSVSFDASPVVSALQDVFAILRHL